jgi:hypothetical protein
LDFCALSFLISCDFNSAFTCRRFGHYLKFFFDFWLLHAALRLGSNQGEQNLMQPFFHRVKI